MGKLIIRHSFKILLILTSEALYAPRKVELMKPLVRTVLLILKKYQITTTSIYKITRFVNLFDGLIAFFCPFILIGFAFDFLFNIVRANISPCEKANIPIINVKKVLLAKSTPQSFALIAKRDV